MKTGYGGNFIDEVVNVGTMDVETLGALFAERAHEIAAFIGEPVVGAGGVIPPEPHYWPEVTRLCREHDILLIADEVITGFGRTGKLWGSQRYGIEPDLITFAKGVTSGYQPLGGVLVGRRVRAPFWDDDVPGAVFRHGYTYSGHAAARPPRRWPTSTSSRGRSLVARVAALEPVLDARGPSARDGAGRRRGPDRRADRGRRVPAGPAGGRSGPARTGVAAALNHGVATRVLRGHALQISPPFVITETEIDTMVDGSRGGSGGRRAAARSLVRTAQPRHGPARFPTAKRGCRTVANGAGFRAIPDAPSPWTWHPVGSDRRHGP